MSSTKQAVVVVLLLRLSNVCISDAHVVLQYPPPRTNNDYLYSFDEGVCDPTNGCSAFCSDPITTPNAPVTLLQVNTPVQIRWNTTVIHEPYTYRIAVNPVAGTGDANFDTNVLTRVTNTDAIVGGAADSPATGVFATTVTFPSSFRATCGADEQQPCVLQLFDDYYFVSCANVRFMSADDDGTPGEVGVDMVEGTPETVSTTTTNTATMTSNFTDGTSFTEMNNAMTPPTSSARKMVDSSWLNALLAATLV